MAAMKSAAGTQSYRASRRRRDAGLTFTFWRWRCALAIVLSAGLGQYSHRLIRWLLLLAAVWVLPENPAMQLASCGNIRFPCAVRRPGGAALGTSGAVIRSVFGNPLAGEPGVINVSRARRFGACLSIVLEPAVLRYFTTPHSRLWVRWRLLHWCISCHVLRAARRFCR